jgi:hypothetical protein
MCETALALAVVPGEGHTASSVACFGFHIVE